MTRKTIPRTKQPPERKEGHDGGVELVDDTAPRSVINDLPRSHHTAGLQLLAESLGKYKAHLSHASYTDRARSSSASEETELLHVYLQRPSESYARATHAIQATYLTRPEHNLDTT